MAGEKTESGGFLAMIDAKIAALQQLRESFIAAMSVGAFGQDIDASALSAAPQGGGGASLSGSAAKGGPIDLPTGVFRDKGLADAIRLYLSIARRKQTQKEIQIALIEGGLATTSEFFEQTLSATLHRMRKTGELLRFKEGWDLAGSYPEGFRQRLEQGKEAPRKRKPKAKKKAEAKKAATPKAQAEQKAKPAGAEPVLRAV